MKYYWCVNCGYYGEFDFYRQRNVKCESCAYEDLTAYEEDEWKLEGFDQMHEKRKNDFYYKDKINGQNERNRLDAK